MAGSWSHITTKKGKFRGVELLDHRGDAYEALEECYGMVHYLAAELSARLGVTEPVIIESARAHYLDGIALSPGVKKSR